ncbi:hypothetical protein ACNO8S_13505 [Haloarcula sp. KBTZ06]|uniref:hypothetical protein n=1 Tax=Haloarcula sp. KBTZ06 TaxID=3402682 RepID=UPI003B428E71
MNSDYPEEIVDELDEKLKGLIGEADSGSFTNIETQILEERAVRSTTDPQSPIDAIGIARFQLARLRLDIHEEYDEILKSVRDDVDRDEQYENLNKRVDEEIDPEEFDRIFEDAKDEVIRVRIRIRLLDEILLFYVLSTGVIEKLTSELFEEELINEEYAGTNKTEGLIKKMTQKQREELLLRTGKVEKETIDKIRRVISIRNELVHDIESQQLLDSDHISNIDNDVDRALNAMNTLHKEVRGIGFLEP